MELRIRGITSFIMYLLNKSIYRRVCSDFKNLKMKSLVIQYTHIKYASSAMNIPIDYYSTRLNGMKELCKMRKCKMQNGIQFLSANIWMEWELEKREVIKFMEIDEPVNSQMSKSSQMANFPICKKKFAVSLQLSPFVV